MRFVRLHRCIEDTEYTYAIRMEASFNDDQRADDGKVFCGPSLI